jgi:hypothetical protein
MITEWRQSKIYNDSLVGWIQDRGVRLRPLGNHHWQVDYAVNGGFRGWQDDCTQLTGTLEEVKQAAYVYLIGRRITE